jgi:hypothetical protein
MTRKIKGKFSLTRASAVSGNEIFVTSSPDMDDHGYPFTRIGHWKDGNWNFRDVDFWTASIFALQPLEAALLGEKGDFAVFPAVETVTKVIDIDVARPPDAPRLGYLTSLRSINGQLYVTGDGGQIYVRSGSGWQLLNASLLDGPQVKAPSVFELETEDYMRQLRASTSLTLWDIAGTSGNDVYVCGGKGNIERALYHWNGDQFSSLIEPSSDPQDYTAALVNILIEKPDRIWTCGHEGALLVGNARDGFVQDAAADVDTLFYSMAIFEGKLHIAGARDIFRHDGDRLTPLRIDTDRKDRGAHTLQAIDGVLWAVSPKDILRYDGNKWERIPYPGND